MLASLLAAAFAAQPVPFEQHMMERAGKQGWSDPAPPIRIFGNVYNVGTCGVVVLLLTGPRGHVRLAGEAPLVNTRSCADYAAVAAGKLDERLASEAVDRASPGSR